MKQSKENSAWRINGFAALLVHVALIGILVLMLLKLATNFSFMLAITFGVMLAIVAISTSGYLVLQPNEARVLIFFGRYVGTVRLAGFSWAMPLTLKPEISLRVRNFASETLKVNDANGNPIEIAAVVVWRVTDTAKALFDVDNYAEFVAIQAETALRGLASKYPYDAHGTDGLSLLGNPTEVAATLRSEVEERLEVAGVDVIEARLTHLAYAPEIAQAMLRRQQADAIIAARQKIVEGAVGMVQMALKQLEGQGVVTLNEERKAAMVNNLLVVLTSEQESQPVLNAGGSD